MTVYVSSVPAVAGSGAAVFVTCRSAERLTVVVEVALSLVDPGRTSTRRSIEAVLVRVPPSAKPESMWTVIVNVSVEPAVRPLELQVTVPAALGAAGLAETKVVPAGTSSVSV